MNIIGYTIGAFISILIVLFIGIKHYKSRPDGFTIMIMMLGATIWPLSLPLVLMFMLIIKISVWLVNKTENKI